MSWPPLGFDLSLSANLKRTKEEEERAQQHLLAIDRDLNTLRDERKKRVSKKLPLEDLLPRVEQLITAAQKLNRPTSEAWAALLLAEILLDTCKPADALARLTTARAAWAAAIQKQQAPERSIDFQFLERMARAHLLMENYAAVSAVCGEAIEKTEVDRYKTSAPYLQSAFLKDRASLYKHGIGAAYKLRDYETMLARAELAKARSLLRYSPENTSKAPDSDLEQRFRDLCDEIRDKDPSGSANPDSLEGLRSLLEERRRIWDLLLIGRPRLEGDNAARPPAFSMQQVRNALEADEAILYYYGLDDGVLFVSYIDREQLLVEPVKVSADGQQSLRDVLIGVQYPGDMGETEKPKFDRAIQDSSYLLPDAFRPLMEVKRRLLISPHQKLHLFPFHALPWKKGFLIEDLAVSYIPNLTILQAPRRLPRKPRILLASGGPYDRVLHLTQLAETGLEVEGAAEAYRRKGIETDLVCGAPLTRKLLHDWSDSGRLAGYSSIHLATHGESVFANENLNTPMESRVFLTAAALDGLEISRLRLDADLIVLSACNSGQRAIRGRGMEELPGDELFGLQAAFAMAGARSVLGCLWPVDDSLARDIMVRFHRHRAESLAPEVALKQATVDHLQSGSSRFCRNWAPFFLSIVGS
jgi:CHAT domain-containing protein